MAMTDMLDKQVGEITLLDGALIGASKVASEWLLSKTFVGNSTFKSGGIKVGAAVALSMLSKNKYAKIVSTGLLIDGMEDLAVATRNKWFAGATGEGQAEIGFSYN